MESLQVLCRSRSEVYSFRSSLFPYHTGQNQLVCKVHNIKGRDQVDLLSMPFNYFTAGFRDDCLIPNATIVCFFLVVLRSQT